MENLSEKQRKLLKDKIVNKRQLAKEIFKWTKMFNKFCDPCRQKCIIWVRNGQKGEIYDMLCHECIGIAKKYLE